MTAKISSVTLSLKQRNCWWCDVHDHFEQ